MVHIDNLTVDEARNAAAQMLERGRVALAHDILDQLERRLDKLGEIEKSNKRRRNAVRRRVAATGEVA